MAFCAKVFRLFQVAAIERQLAQSLQTKHNRLAALGPISFQVSIHLQRLPIMRVGLAPA